MLTPADIKIYFKNNVTQDAFNDNDTTTNDDLINVLITDSYNELEPIENFIPNSTLDSYAKVLTSLSLIDRFGLNRNSFDGLNIKAEQINKIINEAIKEKITNNVTTKKSTNLSIKDDSINIISDSFIQGFIN
jgi:hypothetical protein